MSDLNLWRSPRDLAHDRAIQELRLVHAREIEELRREIGGLRHQLEVVTAERDLALEDFQLERLRNTPNSA